MKATTARIANGHLRLLHSGTRLKTTIATKILLWQVVLC